MAELMSAWKRRTFIKLLAYINWTLSSVYIRRRAEMETRNAKRADIALDEREEDRVAISATSNSAISDRRIEPVDKLALPTFVSNRFPNVN